MKIVTALLLFFLAIPCSHAQLNIYSALTIPDSLKKDANMVMREEYIKLTVKDKNTARYEVRQVFTVMNEQAKWNLAFEKFSDKFDMLDDAEIRTYDLLGNKKNTYTKKDMKTENYGEGLVPEGKLTYFYVNAPTYPLTVEFNYSIKYKGIFSLPGYRMHPPWQSVQHSVFEVEVPEDPGVRYKMVNTAMQPEITRTGNKDIYRWELKNAKAYKLEKYSGSAYAYEPFVFIAPNKFQLDDYEGDMSTWKNFGSWINNLYAKTTGLSEDKKNFYRDMVKTANGSKEKAAILYNYMQHNMRYVSIQLGIGGLRPFPASFVDDKKYGDCKALSNYLKSALDAVDVKSNLVIIQGSTMPRNVYEDFSAHYFNHAILNIPQQNDTIWLECTSTTLPFGELGDWTENRKAMMITDEGGVLVNTPVSNYKNNTESIHTVIEVNEDGGAKVKTSGTLYGDSRNDVLMYYHDLAADDKKKYFLTNMEWKHPDVFEISNSKQKNNPYRVEAVMAYEKMYSFNAGNKLFFEARLYPVFDEEVPEYEKRVRDYYFTRPYQVLDTTVYIFPAGFSLEARPGNKSVQFPFAQYTCNYSWDAATRTLTTIAILQIKDRVIKAADYSKLVDFKKQVLADMNEKIVMKKD